VRQEVAALSVTVETVGAVSLTCSVGVATAPASDVALVDLVREADQALYRAKHDGRNCVRVAAQADPLWGAEGGAGLAAGLPFPPPTAVQAEGTHQAVTASAAHSA
jgi:hypothetical protein